MKRFALYVVALTALVAAGVAYSAASPSAKLHKQDRVYGGGQFGPGCFTASLCFANPRNFAVDAHAQEDGSEAVGDSTYGAPSSTFEERRSVACLRVEGNHAVIGGVVHSGPNAGYWYVQYFVDRGGPAAGPAGRDQASASYEDPADSPSWPDGFPFACPSPTTGFPGGDPVYLDVDEADVVVQDATSN